MKIYNEIQYLNEITGFFPDLQDRLLHGFSWGKNAGNMRVFPGNEIKARVNTQKFLNSLELGSIRDLITSSAEHKDNIFTCYRQDK